MCGFHLSFLYISTVFVLVVVLFLATSRFYYGCLCGASLKTFWKCQSKHSPPSPNRVQEGHTSQITASFSTFNWPESSHSENSGRQTAMKREFHLQFLSRLFFFFFFSSSSSQKIARAEVVWRSSGKNRFSCARHFIWPLIPRLTASFTAVCLCFVCVCVDLPFTMNVSDSDESFLKP